MTLASISTPVENLTKTLHRLMQLRNISEAELARRTNTPQPTLHKILSGKTEDPRCSTLKALAGFFDLSIDELLTGIEITQGNHANTFIQSVPVISWNECANGKQAIKELNTTNWDKWTVCESTSQCAYGLASKPSLEPRFPRGTILIIDFELAPIDGDIIVVHFPETEEATLREFSVDGPSKLLLPLSNNLEPLRLTDDIKILGVLIKSSFNYV
jgi:SOS-response transcriptional repressor LexA